MDIITTSQVPATRPSPSRRKNQCYIARQDAQEKICGTSFLGIIRLVKEGSEGMEAPEESTITQKPKWDQALPSHIRAVLEEFDDVFPQDLPLGLPPMHEGG